MATTDEPARIQRPYCLRCYAPLEKVREACLTCPACGHTNVLADQRLFWSQEPNLVDLEFFFKVGVGFLLAGIFWLMVGDDQVKLGTGQGYAIGFPIVLGAILWETVGKLTRRKPYFRATLFWMAIPLVLALPAVFGVLYPGDAPAVGRAILAAIALVLISLAFLARSIGRRLERWKEDRIRGGQVLRGES